MLALYIDDYYFGMSVSPGSSPEARTALSTMEGFMFGSDAMEMEEIITELRFTGVLPYQGLEGVSPRVRPRRFYWRFRRQYNSVMTNIRQQGNMGNSLGLHQYRSEARDWLQAELQRHPDLLNDTDIATNAMWLGAIPLEDMGFRHRLEPDFSYSCVDCHGPSQIKYVNKSVWTRGCDGGGGQVGRIPVGWCEPCGDTEPPDEGRYITYVGLRYENMWGL